MHTEVDGAEVSSSPTKGASEAAPAEWARKPMVARVLRSVTFIAPIIASWLTTRFTAVAYWRPSGAIGTALWLAQLAVVGTTTVILVGRVSRRLLPLAALYSLSIAFPDQAPSRFKVALRSGNIKNVGAEIDDVRVNGFGADQTEVAARILELVEALRQHERLTRGHTERVRAYSDLIAEELGMTKEDRDKLRWASMLHDIGKLAVPAELLNKAGRPTDEEWKVLASHPTVGGELVEPLADWLGDLRLVASQHHERWDGTGYPNKLAGQQITLASRIVAVADAYDVITSARSYKKPMSSEAARKELVRCAGTQFDPAVVRAFLNVSLGRRTSRSGTIGWLLELPRTLVTAGGHAANATAVAAAATVVAIAPPPVPTSAANVEQVALQAPSSTSEAPDPIQANRSLPVAQTAAVTPTPTPSDTSVATTTTSSSPALGLGRPSSTTTVPTTEPVPGVPTAAPPRDSPSTTVTTTVAPNVTTPPATTTTAPSSVVGGAFSNPTFQLGWTSTVTVTATDTHGERVANATVTVLVEGVNDGGQTRSSNTITAVTDAAGIVTATHAATDPSVRSVRFTLTGINASGCVWNSFAVQITA